MVIPATTGIQAHMLRKHPYKNGPNRLGIFRARVSRFLIKRVLDSRCGENDGGVGCGRMNGDRA